MLLIIPLIIGAVVGALMAWAFRRTDYMARNVILGICGAVLVVGIIYLAQYPAAHGSTSPGVNVLSSAVGASIFTYVPKLIRPIEPSEDGPTLVSDSDRGHDTKEPTGTANEKGEKSG